MFNSRNLLSGKRKYLFGLILLVFISIILVAFSTGGHDDFDIATREVLLRKVGDELLTQSGDNTSRVLPIKKVAENEYQISFEKEFTFLPDSLVNTTRRLLAKDPIAGDYIVNVLNAGNSSVTYGYAISKNKKKDIITCLGRKQPKAPYTIDIKYKLAGIDTLKGGYLLGSVSFLAFIGIVFFRSGKPRIAATTATVATAPPAEENTGILPLGSMLFDTKKQQLAINGNTIDLTGTETRLLLIFAQSPNETIERSRLQKEIWEDEGVIVGRRLDMFISKLRKKLEPDPNIKIIVIRGKGYKLEVGY